MSGLASAVSGCGGRARFIDSSSLTPTLFLFFATLPYQLGRKFPDIGRVKVDKFGNIIGGVNPFEGTDIKLEDQPKPDDDEEVNTAVVSLSKMNGLLRHIATKFVA